jgi:putative phosphoserine phosphatase / 1-acylglycerol-3-phosphate O-acyltransferase
MSHESPARVAAFFDLDGTLLAAPSLERRFFRTLRYRRAIRLRNLFLWLGEAMRLAPRGIAAIAQANKMYLRGVRVIEGESRSDRTVPSLGFGAQEIHGNGRARIPIPAFFPEAIHRVAWHASQGHAIVLVSGTLEPLAEAAARALERQVAGRRIAAEIHVIATRLEEAAGSWTGRLSGPAMFGEEKARAMKRLALNWGIHLAASYAYGDAAHDRWMLAEVGRPAAVNPSQELARIARLQGWPELRWNEAAHETRKRKAGFAEEAQPASKETKHWNAESLG